MRRLTLLGLAALAAAFASTALATAPAHRHDLSKITTSAVQKPPSPGGVFAGDEPAHAPFRRGVSATAGLC